MTNAELDDMALRSDAGHGERTIREAYAFLGRFISYPSEHAHVAHTLWCVHTHLMDKWESTPRLAFLSAEPASGKTRALEITELLVPNAVSAVNVTPAYLFRKIGGGEGPTTVLYDEIDTVFGAKARDNEELRGLLNAGHRKGAVAGRCVVRGKIIETEEIPAYAAVAMGGLGWLPDTILSRSVIIRMRPRHDGERVEQFRHRLHAGEGLLIRDRLASWARSATIEWPALPDEIQDRDADVWESLIAIADAVGSEWPAKARVAAVALIAATREVEASLGVRLLTDLSTIFDVEQELTSKTILERLTALSEAPWADLRGKPLDERGLAKRLKAYEVKPKAIRTAAGILRGYSRADFQDSWRRYLPPSSGKSATSVTSATGQELQAQPVAGVADVSLFPGDREAHKRCQHCQGQGDLVEVHYGPTGTRLHQGCVDAWRAAYDELSIPGFLDRRREAR